jgi:hypothetical protein
MRDNIIAYKNLVEKPEVRKPRLRWDHNDKTLLRKTKT